MHSILTVAGILALVALAFGEAAAVVLARILIIGAVTVIGLFAFDIATHGAISIDLLHGLEPKRQ